MSASACTFKIQETHQQPAKRPRPPLWGRGAWSSGHGEPGGVLRGNARPGEAARINVVAFYGVGMPAALALAFWPGRLDFPGMWVGMLAAQLVCAALMLHAVQSTDWGEQAVRARELTGGGGGGVTVVVADVKSGHADAAKAKLLDNGMLVVTVVT